jgi:hypothetical protein
MGMKTNFVGFNLDDDDLQKLWKLSEDYGNSNSKTMRAIITEAYENKYPKKEA